MGINFPGTPTAGDKFTPAGAGMPTYTWDGEKWTTIGGAIGTGGAPLDSPHLIGDPQAPTPTPGDNDTTIATTAFVKNAVDTAIAAIPPPATAAEFRANSAPTKTLSVGTVWSAAQLVTLVDTGGVITPDLSLGFDFYCGLTGASRTMINPSNGKQGQKGLIFLVGGSVTAWQAAYKFPNGQKPVSSGGWDIYSYYYWDVNNFFCMPATGMA